MKRRTFITLLGCATKLGPLGNLNQVIVALGKTIRGMAAGLP